MLLLLTSAAVAGTEFKAGTDTALLSATEGLVSDFEIETLDNLGLSISDVATLVVGVSSGDNASITLSDNASLAISGTTAKPASDTTSLALTDTGAVSVTLEVTDTSSLTLTGEAGTVDFSQIAKDVTDTASLSLDDQAAQTGVATTDVSVGDAISLFIEDSAAIVDLLPVVLIRFESSPDQIRFTS